MSSTDIEPRYRFTLSVTVLPLLNADATTAVTTPLSLFPSRYAGQDVTGDAIVLP